METMGSVLRVAQGHGWDTEETVGLDLQTSWKKSDLNWPLRGRQVFLFVVLYIFVFLQAGMTGREFQAGNNPMSKGPEVSSCGNSDSSV